MRKPIDWQDDEHQALLLEWTVLALTTAPHPARWGAFVAGLRRAAEDYRHTGDSPQSRLAAIADIAHFLIMFAAKENVFSDDDGAIRGNLLHLITAVMDTQQGRFPDLFIPENHKIALNRPPPSVRAHQTVGAAAMALDELQKAGVDATEAARKVVAAVEAGKCALPGRGSQRPFSTTTVIGWRQRIKARIARGEEKISQLAVDRFNSPLPPHVGPSPLERANFVLSSLRRGVGFR